MDTREGPGTHRGTEDSLEREETEGVSAGLCELNSSLINALLPMGE